MKVAHLTVKAENLAEVTKKLATSFDVYIAHPETGILIRFAKDHEYIGKLRRIDAITELEKTKEYIGDLKELNAVEHIRQCKNRRTRMSGNQLTILTTIITMVASLISAAITYWFL